MARPQNRPDEPKVPVWSPKGEREEHYRYNATDLVRHCGWSFTDPATVQARDKAVAKMLADDSAIPQGYTQLDVWRKMANDMGIRVDASWGIRKLQAEIENFKRMSRGPLDIKVDPADLTPQQKDAAIKVGDAEIPAEVALMQKIAAQQAAEDAADGFEDTTSPAAVAAPAAPETVETTPEKTVEHVVFSEKIAKDKDPIAKLNAARKAKEKAGE